jgi:hypothetical protein
LIIIVVDEKCEVVGWWCAKFHCSWAAARRARGALQTERKKSRTERQYRVEADLQSAAVKRVVRFLSNDNKALGGLEAATVSLPRISLNGYR